MSSEPIEFGLPRPFRDLINSARWRDWRIYTFYLGVPFILGLYSALNNRQLLEAVGFSQTIGFYMAQSVPPYWLTCMCSFAVMFLLRRWKPAPLVIMLCGVFLSCFGTAPYAFWIESVFQQQWHDPQLSQLRSLFLSSDFWLFLLRAAVLWVGVNFVFDRFIGLPRYRYTIPRGYEARDKAGAGESATAGADLSTDRSLPGFLERLPVRVALEDVLAIRAEQHYIRIVTAQREHMVLYRFSDAVRELGDELGLQVHRSNWVSRKGFDCLQSGGKKFGVRLTTGAFIPVSVPYQGVVKQLARDLGAPCKPLPAKQN